MSAFDSDYLRISYRPDLHVLFMRWTRPATSAEHRAGYLSALQLAEEQQARQWLIDLRSRGLADVADLHWILQEFAAAFQQALPGPERRLAYFTTPYYAEVLEPRLAQFNNSGSGLAIRVFTEEMPAYDWLRTGR
ncbi:hypothetical protein HNQ93_004000 [Hymenobacter luteus]|uniref:STAS/SEC14 domain-containing protein n=2 Tax=Hymenobacter TaxID=89966 RepID=A0A7W9T3V9_9BACT|nr:MULTISPECIES: hypothetical protein [Hymenobacter]MBB4603320.1 hypothetical protein [Hymenobacter latericoloratus]MBB6061122.1 hypothetical protein [Hymenobacter luteus]